MSDEIKNKSEVNFDLMFAACISIFEAKKA